MKILVLCFLLCGCGTYMYPKFVEIAEAACKRNDGWINVYRSYYSKQYYLEITCKDGAVFNETVLEADARP